MPEWLKVQLQATLNIIPTYTNGLSVLMDRFVTSGTLACPRPAARCSRGSLEQGSM